MDTTQKNKIKTPSEISILLVEENIDPQFNLKTALLSFEYLISKYTTSTKNLLEMCLRINPDILIMKIKIPTSPLLTTLAKIAQLAPLPIIILAEQDTPALITTTMKVGVSAYVVNETQPMRLKNLITATYDRFKKKHLLGNEQEQIKTQLINRKLIDRATLLLMEQKHINEQAAFNTLQKMAMNNGHSLEFISKNIIEVSTLLNHHHF